MANSENKNKGERDRRVTYLIIALVILFIVVLVMKLAIFHHKHKPKPPVPPPVTDVQGMTLTRGTQPVCVTAYGTAQSAKVISLLAPFEARIVGSDEPYPGQFVQAEEVIFQLDTRQIDLTIAAYKAQIRQLEVNAQELIAAIKLMEDQITVSKQLIAINEATVQTREADFALQRQIFDANASLFSTGDISYSSYLAYQEQLNGSQIAMFQAGEALGQSRNAMDQLAEQLVRARADLCNIPNQIDELMAHIKQQLIERSKGRVSVPWPAGVVSVSAQAAMEVLPGTPMATVQSMDAIEIPINVPDSYLYWVYNSPGFTQVSLEPNALPEITIQLVNARFRKTWKDGYIKAISQNVNVPTRSLPIVVGRLNKIDEEGQIVPEDALRPGMYCKVSLHLDDIPNAFMIPIQALQIQNRIYYAVPVEGKSNTYELQMLNDVKILYESPGGAVVQLPDQFETITIVAHQLMQAQQGMLLSIHEEKPISQPSES
jgi:multidrug efflux pump subunit AcrA (membrane-fusion protein)